MPETFPRPPIPESGQPPEQFEPGRAIWAAPPTTSEVVMGSAETEFTVDSARSAVDDAFGPDTVVVSSVGGEESSEFDELGYQQDQQPDSGNATGTSVPKAGRFKKLISRVKKERKTEDNSDAESVEEPSLAAELRKVASEKRKEAAELQKVAAAKRKAVVKAFKDLEAKQGVAIGASRTLEMRQQVLDEKQRVSNEEQSKVNAVRRASELRYSFSEKIPRNTDREGNIVQGYDEDFVRKLLDEFNAVEAYNKGANPRLEFGGDGSYRRHNEDNFDSMLYLASLLHEDFSVSKEGIYYALGAGTIDHDLAKKFKAASLKLAFLSIDEDKKYNLGPGGKKLKHDGSDLRAGSQSSPGEQGTPAKHFTEVMQIKADKKAHEAHEALGKAKKAKKVAEDAQTKAYDAVIDAHGSAYEAQRIADEAQSAAVEAQRIADEAKKAEKLHKKGEKKADDSDVE